MMNIQEYNRQLCEHEAKELLAQEARNKDYNERIAQQAIANYQAQQMQNQAAQNQDLH